MYDDLILRLRDAAKMSDALAVLLPHSEGNATAKLYNEAADAIAELSKRVDESIPKDDAEIIIAEVAKPRWIPVTERLPKEADGMVFVLMPDVFPYNSKQPFVDCNQDRRIEIAHYSEHSGKWYFGDCCAVGGQEPIAWIHRSVLPEPPKEW